MPLVSFFGHKWIPEMSLGEGGIEKGNGKRKRKGKENPTKQISSYVHGKNQQCH